VYLEHGYKNRNGGFYQLHVENKRVEILKNPDAGNRCLVFLLDLYLGKLPKETKKQNVFYCRLLQHLNEDQWYSAQPRGKHFLSNMVKNMLQDAKIEGHLHQSQPASIGSYTNVSTRST